MSYRSSTFPYIVLWWRILETTSQGPSNRFSPCKHIILFPIASLSLFTPRFPPVSRLHRLLLFPYCRIEIAVGPAECKLVCSEIKCARRASRFCVRARPVYEHQHCTTDSQTHTHTDSVVQFANQNVLEGRSLYRTTTECRERDEE